MPGGATQAAGSLTLAAAPAATSVTSTARVIDPRVEGRGGSGSQAAGDTTRGGVWEQTSAVTSQAGDVRWAVTER